MDAQRLLAAIFCLILFSSEARSQFLFNRIAITREPTQEFVAGTPGSITFDSLYGPIIDEDGNVIFEGSILSQTGTDDGIWFHRRSLSRLELQVKENAQVSLASGGSPNTFFGSTDGQPTFGPLKLETGVTFTYRARLKGSDTTVNDDTAAYRYGFQVAREGGIFDINRPDMRRVGDLFEFSNLAQETSRRPYRVQNSPTSADTAFPESAGNSLYYDDILEGVSLTDGTLLGDVRDARVLIIPYTLDTAFRGTVTGPNGAELPNNQRIFRQNLTGPFSARPQVIATQGEFVTADVRTASFYQPATGILDRNSGQYISYAARLSGINVNSFNDSGLISGRNSLFLREGAQVPGAAAGVVFGDLGTDNLVGGGQGVLIFNNQLQGPTITATNDWALIASKFTSRILAQEGQHVDGLPIGSVLTGLDAPHFQLNLVGEAIFNAEFAGPNGNGLGLFYTHTDQGGPRLVVHTGQQFDIGDGVFKTIRDIGLMEMSSSRDGRASQINDAGQITFSLTFTDGTQGIFTAIPEPATAALALIGVMVAMALHRRSKKRPVTF